LTSENSLWCCTGLVLYIEVLVCLLLNQNTHLDEQLVLTHANEMREKLLMSKIINMTYLLLNPANKICEGFRARQRHQYSVLLHV
jgi:hypothetical protein